jgi:hypothetical protein
LLKKAIETLTTPKPITRVKEKLKKKVKEIKDKENINLKKTALSKTQIIKSKQDEDISMIDVGQEGRG